MGLGKKAYEEINDALTESLVESIRTIDHQMLVNAKLIEYILFFHHEMTELTDVVAKKGKELFDPITKGNNE
jgi:hypothetical protein